MGNWFEVKASYDKTMENGTQKKVTEPYLIDALSHAEAENRAIEELKPFIAGEFTIVSVRRKKLAELFFNTEGDRYYQVKINFITLDEKSGTEKKTLATMYVQASTIEDALAVFRKGMKGTMADYTIIEVKETLTMDVFPYESEEKKEGGD